MARRVMGGALALSALLGVPQSHAADPPKPQLPMAACESRVNDVPGDGIPEVAVPFVAAAKTNDPRGTVDGLDIRGITIRLTSNRVFAFMTLKALPAKLRETDSAYGYTMWFSRGPKIARFDQVLTNSTHQTAGLSPTVGYPNASVGTTTGGGVTSMRGLGGGVDQAKGVVYVYADRDSLEEQLGEPLADGDQLTGISGRTVLFESNGATASAVTQWQADETEVAAADAVQTVGANSCFAASPIVAPAVSAQYGDGATLTATLTDEAGAPMAERRVSFTAPGDSAPRALTTDAQGKVTVALEAAPVAGSYPFRVAYRGDETSGDGLVTSALTVTAEPIRMTPLKVAKSGTVRTVSVTLTDDDPRAFAAQPVDWYVNGKKAATIKTDANGKSAFRAKPGQKVQARYAGAAGRYVAARSNTVTA